MPGQQGNPGGKKGRSGRKSKAEELGLVALLDKCWRKADREKCLRALARSSNDPPCGKRTHATKLLMAYAYVRPREKHEISNPDGSPLMAPLAEAMVKVYGGPHLHSK